MGLSAQPVVSHSRDRERGAALVFALVALLVMGILVGGAAVMASSQYQASNQRNRAALALQVAEAGTAHAVGLLRGPLANTTFTNLLRGPDNTSGTADDSLLINYGLPSGQQIPAAGVTAYGGTYTARIMNDPAESASPFTDVNGRVILRCTSTLADGSTSTVETLIAATPFPGVAVDGNLEISSAAEISGACGGVHANGNLTGGGHPDVTTLGSATGTVSLDVTPNQSGAPVLDIPDLNPADYWSSCDFFYTGNWVLNVSKASGTWCITGNVTSSGDFGSWASKKVITVIATGSIKISSKPFIKADHPDGILLLAGGDLDLQGDWGGEGLVYARSQCYVSSKPQILGSLVCKNKPNPAGSINYTNTNLISGDADITFDCSNMFTKRRIAGWWPRFGA
jgi:hypothetical protein